MKIHKRLKVRLKSMTRDSNSDDKDNISKVAGGHVIEYKKGQMLGSGTFGNVHQCLNQNTGELMAVKSVKVTDPVMSC